MRKLKCYGYCGQKYEKSELLVYSNKNYCKSCYEKTIKENDDRVTLYNLIKSSYNVIFPTSMHLAQIKRCKDNGYSYEDMILGLRYCLDVLRLKFNPKMGFGYVVNNIEAAKVYFEEMSKRQISNDNIFEESILSQKVVKVAKIDMTNTFKESKKIKLEDII